MVTLIYPPADRIAALNTRLTVGEFIGDGLILQCKLSMTTLTSINIVYKRATSNPLSVSTDAHRGQFLFVVLFPNRRSAEPGEEGNSQLI